MRISVEPATTYPNHYSIVTGLYPANHGLTANYVFDPVLNDYYHFGAMDAGINHRQWWEAKPIWVTAEEAGLITASVFLAWFHCGDRRQTGNLLTGFQ